MNYKDEREKQIHNYKGSEVHLRNIRQKIIKRIEEYESLSPEHTQIKEMYRNIYYIDKKLKK